MEYNTYATLLPEVWIVPKPAPDYTPVVYIV